MTVRTRVTLAAGFAVLVAVVATSVGAYLVVRNNLYDQVDQSLSRRHDNRQRHELQRGTSTAPEHLPLAEQVFMQVVDREGQIITRFGDRPLPVTADVLAVARGQRTAAFFTVAVDGASVRAYATPAGQGTALQVGRSLAEVEEALHGLMLTLIAIAAAAVGLAAMIGRLVAATAVRPVHRVAEAAEAVARTGELTHHIAVPGGDDLSRLAASFNTMLDALSRSLTRQRQLVADASHELRTPLATVRTNVEVLTRSDELAPDEKTTLIRDTVTQISELTRLVDDLVELARGDGHDEPFVVVDLDDLTRRAVGTARHSHPSTTFRIEGFPTLVRGAPARITRAISNLIDNAVKWSPPAAEIRITVRDGTVTIRDHGPGFDPADLPQVFERFYRSPRARSMPGSGLGLAIVKQVADSHGGTVRAANGTGGGALVELRLPTGAGDAGPA